MKRFLVRRWFLLALVGVTGAGVSFPHALDGFASALPRPAIVAMVLLIMALPLKFGTVWQSLRRPGPVLLAVALNYGILPPVAWLWSHVLPLELAVGLVIMSTVPCTLASVSVWTRRAGGNEAVAILVTLVTNITCLVVTPLWLALLTETHVQLELFPLVLRLGLIVLLPILAAQLLRQSNAMAEWATSHKCSLGVLAQCGILTMVFIGSVRCGLHLSSVVADQLGLTSWASMIASVVGLHGLMLGLGFGLSWCSGFTRPDCIAVGFGASQKTLMVGLDLGLQYYSDQYTGLVILPMVAYHVCQLLVDTLIADRLALAEQADR